MVWANIMLLGLGGLLISIPVILHFLMQPKPKKMPFPALRFVKRRQGSNRSRMRLRNLLLLLLRCLLIALLALALAGPSVASQEYGNWLTLGGIGFSALIVGLILAAAIWMARKRNWVFIYILGLLFLAHLVYGGWSAVKLLGNDSVKLIGDSQAPVAALVVVDTSPRMLYTRENSTRLERVKQLGDWLLGQFPADSQVCVLATDHDSPFFSVDVSAAGKRLATLDISYDSGFIPDALAEGVRLLEKAPQERKEVYVLTDLTARSWAAENTRATYELMKKNDGINVFVIDVGVKNAENFLLATPQLKSDLITRSAGLKLSSELVRVGAAAQRTVRLRIEQPNSILPVIRDGKTITPDKFWERTTTVDVRKDRGMTVDFSFNESLEPGIYHGTLEVIGKDALAIDNIRYFTFSVTEAFKVLVVHPDNVNPSVVVDALAPESDRSSGASIFQCTTVAQSDMSSKIEDYDAVLLLDPKPIASSSWKALENYVSGGGGLGIFLGHNAARGPTADPSFQSENAQRVLSGKLTDPWRRPDRKLFLSPDNFSHPLFAPFRGIEMNIPWQNHPVMLHWGIEPDGMAKEFPTQTLMRYGNGQAALIERQIGDGRVLVMTTPITEPSYSRERKIWNELFVGRAWPTWMLLNQVGLYLIQNEAETLNVLVGRPAVLRNEWETHPDSYLVFTPHDGQAPSQINVPDSHLRYRFTDMPGQYRLKGKLDGKTVLRGFSVNLRNEDTDLTRIEPEFLDEVLGFKRYQIATEKNEIQRQQGTTRRGQEFYPLLILMMVVVLAVEFLMSNRFYNTK